MLYCIKKIKIISNDNNRKFNIIYIKYRNGFLQIYCQYIQPNSTINIVYFGIFSYKQNKKYMLDKI